MMDFLEHYSDRLSRISEKGVEYALIVMMAVMSVTIILQVLLRYVFLFSLSWSEEVARYLMIWVAFLGASLALKKRLHLGVEFVVTRLNPLVRKRVALLSQGLILIFLIYLIIGGIRLSWAVRDQFSPALLFSMSFAYLCVPVGGLLMAIQLLHLMLAGRSQK